MALGGELSTVPLMDIMQVFESGRKTGILEVFREGDRRKIYFRDGKVIGAEAPDVDIIGRILLNRGSVTRDDLHKAAEGKRESESGLGESLKRLGYLAEEDLDNLRRLEEEEIIYDIFGWTSGEFIFREEAVPPRKRKLEPLRVTNLIIEGSRRIDEWGEIRKIFDSQDLVVRVCSDSTRVPENVKIGFDELQVLARIDGEKTVGEIGATSVIGEFRTLQALTRMVQDGLVEKTQRPVRQTERREEAVQDMQTIISAFNLCYRRVRKELRRRLGRATERKLKGILEEMRSYYGVIFDGVEQKEGGDVDASVVLKNLEKIHQDFRIHHLLRGLSLLLSRQVHFLRDVLGKRAVRAIEGEIKESIEKLWSGQGKPEKGLNLCGEITRIMEIV